MTTVQNVYEELKLSRTVPILDAPLTEADRQTLIKGLVVALQDWQGSQGLRIEQYARGWLQFNDPDFRDKGITGLEGYVRSYQKGTVDGYEIVGVGDGTKTVFPVRAGAQPTYGNSLEPALVTMQTVQVTRGGGDVDDVNWYCFFRKVYDASGEYQHGTDWVRSGDDAAKTIHWVTGGRRPAAGAVYSVDYLSRYGTNLMAPLANDAITVLPAPAPGQHVIAGYVFNPPGQRKWQETLGDCGGFNAVYVDAGYATRFFAAVCRAYGILKDDPAFPADLRATYDALLPRWWDYVKTNGYNLYLQSNYGAGEIEFLQVSAWLMADGVRQKWVDDYWTANVHQITGPAPSLKGGFWPEGYSYGGPAAIRVSNIARYQELRGTDISGIRQWWHEVATYLAHASPGTGYRRVVALGDWFTWPTPFPQAVADYLAARGVMLPDRATLPTDYKAEGTGVYHSRTDWSPDSMLVTISCGPLLACDHQQYTPGHFQIELGDEPFVMNGPVLMDDQSGAPKSKLGNVPQIQGSQNYSPGMGYWYDGRNFERRYAPGPSRTEWSFEPGAAYSLNMAPDTGGPVKSWGRDFYFLKSQKTLVVSDRLKLREVVPWWVQACMYDTPDTDGWFKMTAGTRTLYVKAFDPDNAGYSFAMSADSRFLKVAPNTPAAQSRVVMLFAADVKPAVTLDKYVLTVNGETVTLSQDWATDLPDWIQPTPSPTPSPTPNPSPIPVPLPDPVIVLDAASYKPVDKGPTVTPNAYNGHAALSFASGQSLDLGNPLSAATEFGFLLLVRRPPGTDINKLVLSYPGKLTVSTASWLSSGYWVTWSGQVGPASRGMAVGNQINLEDWHCVFGSYRVQANGMITAADATWADAGNSAIGPLAAATGGLVVNPETGAVDIVCLKIWSTGVSTKDEAYAEIGKVLAAYAPPPPTPPPPPPPPPAPKWVEEYRSYGPEVTGPDGLVRRRDEVYLRKN